MADTVMTPIDLDEPLKRGETKIDKLKARRPGGGELRGLATIDILRQDYATIAKLASRAMIPPITEAEFGELCPADIMQVGSAFADFFMSRQARISAGL